MEYLKRIIHILATILYFFIILYVIVCIPILFGCHPIVVLSGSMEPKLQKGSVIYYEKCLEKDLKEGDIITFEIDKKIISHRINQIDNGLIETKGDANDSVDALKIHYENIKGKVINFSIPFIGYYILLVNNHLKIAVIVCIIILVSEFLLSNIGTIDINKEKEKEKEK